MVIMVGRRIGAAHPCGEIIPTLSATGTSGENSLLGTKAWDRHLRSSHAVTGYHLQALDGEIGHVEDFVIDDETWAIHYLVVGTITGGRGKRSLFHRSGSSELGGASRKCSSIFRARPSRSPRNIRKIC